jgi:hypothetical protein
MIVMNIAATYTTLTATFWLTLWLTWLIIITVNAAAAGFLPLFFRADARRDAFLLVPPGGGRVLSRAAR